MQTDDMGVNKFLIPGAVVLAGLFIGGAVLWNGSHATPGVGGGEEISVNIKDVETADDPYYGDPKAPVVIAFWSDYQCPFCMQFAVNTLPQIVQEYVTTGKARVVFKDFQFLGPNSTVIGEYSRAVWALYPDQYYAWHSALFADHPEENSLSPAQNLAYIERVTKTVSGINWDALTADVKANKAKYDSMMAEDRAEASKFGIQATPSFIIGKQLIQGAQPYANFKAAIEEVLK